MKYQQFLLIYVFIRIKNFLLILAMLILEKQLIVVILLFNHYPFHQKFAFLFQIQYQASTIFHQFLQDRHL